MSALVPPISTVIRLRSDVCLATADAATTPEAGPDRMVSIGRWRAVSMLSVPPLLLVMYTGAAMPSRRMRALSFAR